MQVRRSYFISPTDLSLSNYIDTPRTMSYTVFTIVDTKTTKAYIILLCTILRGRTHLRHGLIVVFTVAMTVACVCERDVAFAACEFTGPYRYAARQPTIQRIGVQH